jgi:hypothetical protein
MSVALVCIENNLDLNLSVTIQYLIWEMRLLLDTQPLLSRYIMDSSHLHPCYYKKYLAHSIEVGHH